MTFTLAARCPETGQFGIVISSSSPGSRRALRPCPRRRRRGGQPERHRPRARPPPARPAGGGPHGGRGAGRGHAATRRTSTGVSCLSSTGTGAARFHRGGHALGTLGRGRRGRERVAGGNLLAERRVPPGDAHRLSGGDRPFGDRLVGGSAGRPRRGGRGGAGSFRRPQDRRSAQLACGRPARRLGRG